MCPAFASDELTESIRESPLRFNNKFTTEFDLHLTKAKAELSASICMAEYQDKKKINLRDKKPSSAAV